MLPQPAMTTSTVVNVVSRISGIEMPSTPTWNCESTLGIHGAISDELHRRRGVAEVQVQRHAERQRRERHQQRGPARGRRPPVAERQHAESADDRHPDQQREEVSLEHHARHISHISSDASPRIIANA